ncbi:MBL fold metallo-hydrolase [Acetobacteraceae bacterium H6797]|nr:MBL fold metallo-hydrolase [Acetobacteraceae bacterium H6797]
MKGNRPLLTRRAAAALGLLPFFGGRARADAPSARPVSDHFDGRRFFNPGGSQPRGLIDVLRWKMTGNQIDWPDRHPSPFPPHKPPARVGQGALRVTFVGHASFLIQGEGLNILTDPVWSERVSPFTFAGPKRVNAPGIRFEDLPKIDIVLVSHGHYDHLDTATLAKLWERDRPRIITALGNDLTIKDHNAAIEVEAGDWGDSLSLGHGVEVSFEPVHHWTARGIFDRNRALWCGFMLRGIGGGVFFTGDSGFDGGRPFSRVAARHGAPALALLPIGAYEPRWFMKGQHMNPEDAVQAFTLLGAKQALGYHWGTFQLTDEGVENPAADLDTALAKAGLDAERFLAARPGQIWTAGGVS